MIGARRGSSLPRLRLLAHMHRSGDVRKPPGYAAERPTGQPMLHAGVGARMTRPVWCLAFLSLIASVACAAKDECLSSRGRIQGTLQTRCESLTHEGRARTYRLYVPARLREHAPLLFVLHGGGGSGSNMELMTRQEFNRIAESDGAI